MDAGPVRALARAVGRIRCAHRHVTRTNATLVAVSAAVVGTLIAGSVQLASGASRQPQQLAPERPATLPASAPAVPSAASPRSVPAALPKLPPLHPLIQAAVLVTSNGSLSSAAVRRIVALSGANASLLVAAGDVELNRGRTRAVAADPLMLRVWTPANTGRVDGVWQRAMIGEAVVAHAVAKADAVPLGGAVVVRHGASTLRPRVGAFATTQFPGVGLVVNVALGRQLGLTPDTGLLLAVQGTDPAVVAAVLGRALGRSATVEPVLSAEARSGSWVPPAIGPITSPFGMRINPFTHLPEFHEGIDIGAPFGAPVYAMSDGQVLYAGPASGYGQEIILSHAGGVSTVYGHVSQIFVTAGPVKVGQVIALVGNEGESTGPHLHAEVHVQDQPVDPVAWLSAHGVQFSR